MALFDAFSNLSPDQTQGLLSAAAALLQAGGPSRIPTSFGQALGSGLQAFQQGVQGAQDRRAQQEQQRMNSRLLGLRLQDAESDIANQAASRARAQRLQEFYQSGGGANIPQLPSMAPTIENAQALQAAQSAAGAGDLYSQRLNEAQRLRTAGFGPEADAVELQALKFREEFDQTPRTGVDEQGKPFQYVVGKGGTVRRLDGILPRDELKLMNLGGREVAYNPFALASGQEFTRTASPDAMLTDRRLREQNMIAREANQIAQGQKVATNSTALRKEFDDLPEVKNYKQALPAYSAIVDAAKRNTPQADINLVYGIAKLYDPTSVVREGEYNTVANSPNIPDRIKGYAQYLTNGGKLTPQVKKQILDEATGRIGSYENEYVATRNNYTDIAARSGADPSLLFPSGFKPAAEKAQASNQKKISLADIAATARASGRTTAEVTAAARAKGYIIGDR